MVVTMAIAGCSGSSDRTATGDDAVPRIEPAAGDLAAVIGTTFDAAGLPPALEAESGPDPLFGSLIISLATESDAAVAMHWVERGDHVNVLMSDQVAVGDQGPTWQAHSAWLVVLDPTMVFTVGTTVCKPLSVPAGSEARVFVAVVNGEQNRALGAWLIGREGPTPYPEPETLDCERFVP